MTTKKEKAKALGLNYSTYLFREQNGITMDKPVNKKPGGHYLIDETKAKAIWADIKSGHFNRVQQIADKHGVPKSLIWNMNSGRSWNEITGIKKKVYEEDLS